MNTRPAVLTVASAALLTVLTLTPVWGHVALTYPLARQYDLDFLDNSRTQGPCGMPKGNASTLLVQGSSVDVTWHLAYPHQGGYRLELLDPEQRLLADLTNEDGKTLLVNGDPTAQSHRITLPQDTLCTGCTLRLLRQAAEWGPRYHFWSCADIDIVERRFLREKCSSNGRYMVNRCKCNTGYYGSACQYSNECEKDDDCGAYGKCVDIDATTYPKKQCYCQQGRFGAKCSKVSLLRGEKQVDFALYHKRDLGSKLKLYYRVIDSTSEIEVALVGKGTSYLALGWRPSTATATCRQFPYISGSLGGTSWKEKDKELLDVIVARMPKATTEPVPKAEPEPDAKAEPEPDSKSEPEPSAEPEPKTGSQSATESKPKSNKTEPTVVGQLEPQAKPEPGANPEPGAEPEPGAKPEPNAKPEPDAKPEPNAEPEPDAKNELGAKPAPGAKPEIFGKPASDGSVTSAPEPEPEPNTSPTVTTRPTSRRSDFITTPSTTPHDEAVDRPTSLADRLSGLLVPRKEKRDTEHWRSKRFAVPLLKAPSAESQNLDAEEEEELVESVTEGSAEPEPEPEPKLAKLSADTPWVPQGDTLHGMDCTDIVIGTAYGNHYRIMDYYTRDRSTPKVDEYWGGEESLTAALGWEKDGETTIVFRRPLTASHPTDHPIENGLMHVIWAIGQEPGMYVHSPPSGLEKEKPSVPDFYKRDELKYHGKGDQRGTLSLNFFGEAAGNSSSPVRSVDWCGGQWGYPAGCSVEAKTCEYHARWEYFDATDDIRFTITATEPDKWTGIGFSDNTRMSQTDVILGYVDDRGQSTMFDGWLVGYQGPTMDRHQTMTQQSIELNDGIVTMDFRRKRLPNDDKDLQFTDTSCLYLAFPVNGGKVTYTSKRLAKHGTKPIFSTERVCIKSCNAPGPGGAGGSGGSIVFTTTPRPPQLMYEAELMLTGLGEFPLPRRDSQAYNTLQERIKSSLVASVNKLPGYDSMEISSLTPGKTGEINAKMLVALDKGKYEAAAKAEPLVQDVTNGNAKQSKVYQVLNNSISSGSIGALTVNPSFLKVNQLLGTNQNVGDVTPEVRDKISSIASDEGVPPFETSDVSEGGNKHSELGTNIDLDTTPEDVFSLVHVPASLLNLPGLVNSVHRTPNRSPPAAGAPSMSSASHFSTGQTGNNDIIPKPKTPIKHKVSEIKPDTELRPDTQQNPLKFVVPSKTVFLRPDGNFHSYVDFDSAHRRHGDGDGYYVVQPSADSVRDGHYVVPQFANSVKDEHYVVPQFADSDRDRHYVVPQFADSARDRHYVVPQFTESVRERHYVLQPSADSSRDQPHVLQPSAHSARDRYYVVPQSADSARNRHRVPQIFDSARDRHHIGPQIADSTRDRYFAVQPNVDSARNRLSVPAYWGLHHDQLLPELRDRYT